MAKLGEHFLVALELDRFLGRQVLLDEGIEHYLKRGLRGITPHGSWTVSSLEERCLLVLQGFIDCLGDAV